MTYYRFQLAVLVATAMIAGPGLAQDDAVQAAAEAYVSGPGQQIMIDQLLAPETVVSQIRRASPDLPDDVAEMVGAIAAEELSVVRAPLEAAMVTAAAQTFTLGEIEALDAFYRTPEGLAILNKMQPFMDIAMTLVAPELHAAQEKIMQRSFEAMQTAQ